MEGITIPFSEKFSTLWEQWKDYKLKEFKFKYRGIHSEQAAIMELVNLSGGDEDLATKIILQSLAAGWRGFWPVKNPTSPDGKQKQSGSLRERVQRAVNKKFGGEQVNGSEPNPERV